MVPHNWSPINWSLWTNSPQPILSPWTNGPPKFGPPGQMVPRIFCLSSGASFDDLEILGPNWLGTICPGGSNFWGPLVHGDKIFGDHLSMGTKFDLDPLSMGTKLVGDHLSMGTKFLGTICPWGQEVGDQKSGDQMGLGPNEWQPYSYI